MTTLFGIPNCDTVRKARRWLDENEVSYSFHDFRADGLDQAKLQAWIETLGVDQVVNRRGTSYRKLSDDEKSQLDGDLAYELIQRIPTLIKRPVLETEALTTVGFRPEAYAKIFQS